MKKQLLALISVFLVLAMLLTCMVGCNEDPPPTPAPDNGDTPPSSPAADPYVHAETYFKPEQFNTLKAALEAKNAAFGPIDATMAPAVSLNIDTFAGCSITSISIPVHKTLAADSSGDFTYTVNVIGSSLDGMRSAPVNGITLRINAEEYGLTENATVYRYITVDLSDSPLILGPDETLALGSADDTLIAAYVKASAKELPTEFTAQATELLLYVKKECGEPGMFKNGASSSLVYDNDLLCFDFVIEKTFESKAAYDAFVADQKATEDAFNAKVQALKDAGYKGKKLSIMGDSISTFSGVSNDPSFNTTISSNEVWNTKYQGACDWTLTWWGRLASVLEMELCVPNAWSGSKVYGTESKNNGADSMLMRADQMHQDGGTPNAPSDDTPPDLIIIYMSVNDMLNSPRDAFLEGVSDVAGATKTWFENVVQPKYNLYDSTQHVNVNWENNEDPSATYANWQQAYAMSLMLMQETYPNAEIWVMSLVESNAHNSSKKVHVDHANLYIRAMADYLNIGVIDQQRNGYITKANAYLYGADEHVLITALHPNIKGHNLMMRLIVDELYKKLP